MPRICIAQLMVVALLSVYCSSVVTGVAMLGWDDSCALAAQNAADYCSQVGRAVSCFLERPEGEQFGQNIFHLTPEEDLTVYHTRI